MPTGADLDPWMVERNHLRDEALADLEEYRDWPAWLGRQTRGFGAGVVDPFGLSAAGLGFFGSRVGRSRFGQRVAPNFADSTRAVQDALNKASDEAPTAHMAGSMTGPGYGWARVFAHATRREAAELAAILWGASPLLTRFHEAFSGAGERRENERRALEYGAAGY